MQNIPKARLRKLRTWSPGKDAAELVGKNDFCEEISLLDLASNDYLGLSRHPNLIEAATTIVNRDGVGAGASPLVTGNRPIHEELKLELISIVVDSGVCENVINPENAISIPFTE